MVESLDLTIANYTVDEIEAFFRFKKGSKYKAGDVDYREYEIREQLLSSGHINKRFKRDLLEFLRVAKEWLIQERCELPKVPTTIPKGFRLDPLDTPKSAIPPSREEELITKTETQYIHTSPSEFLPGSLNPLKTRIITKCLNIDTRFRENLYTTQSSDFMIQLPIKFNKVVSMQLAAFEFPVTFYGISEYYGNNYLYMSIDYIPIGNNLGSQTSTVTHSFIIPDGNYNSLDFIDKLNAIFLSESVTTNTIFQYVSFTLDVTATGSGSGKVTLAPTGTYSSNIRAITLDFTRDKNGVQDMTNVASRIGWNLGFIKPIYSGSTTYVADTIVEPAAIRYAFLSVDDFNNSNNNHFISAFQQSILSPSILARFPIRGSYYSLMMETDYNLVSEPRKYFGPVDIQRLRIRLYDEFGRILAMNQSNFSFSLIFKIVYDL